MHRDIRLPSGYSCCRKPWLGIRCQRGWKQRSGMPCRISGSSSVNLAAARRCVLTLATWAPSCSLRGMAGAGWMTAEAGAALRLIQRITEGVESRAFSGRKGNERLVACVPRQRMPMPWHGRKDDGARNVAVRCSWRRPPYPIMVAANEGNLLPASPPDPGRRRQVLALIRSRGTASGSGPTGSAS